MGTYAVTGSASGMGRETAARLRDNGHSIIGVDIKDADIVADLSTPGGRKAATDRVLAASGDRLDGAVLAAGLGPGPGRDRIRQIAAVNYFGVVELLATTTTFAPSVAASAARQPASNSTTTVPAVPRRAVKALLAHDADKAVRAVRLLGPAAPTMMYGASKIAVSRWVRRHAVLPEWAGSGVRLNALSPGAIMTPLLQEQLSNPRQAKAVRSFPVPLGGFGDAGHMADWMCFMLSDAADFLCGSVVFVDGGTDAYFRPDDWPKAVPAHRLPGYLRRFKGFH